MQMSRRQLLLRLAIGLAGVVGIGMVALERVDFSEHHGTTLAEKAAVAEAKKSEPPVVKTIHPKRDDTLQVSVELLAVAEPFYQANLRARASGVVSRVTKDIGERVSKGELLIEIDVPDLEKDVAQKRSIVEQRRQELRAAEVDVRRTEAKRETAKASVALAESAVNVATSTVDYQGKRLTRYRTLASRDAIGQDVVDEQERDYQASVATLEGSKVSVTKAKADLQEMAIAVEAAQVEVELKRALVRVAENDLEKAQSLADYARIHAPFDGVVLSRRVDPGSFVQNATSGQSEPLMRLARMDRVTIVSKLPDNAAPFLTQDTQATVEMNELPGISLSGALSRFSPAIETGDRTVRVEVDLFNGEYLAYQAYIAQRIRTEMTALATGISPATALNAGLLGIGRMVTLANDGKGAADRLASFPMPRDSSLVQTPKLLPGMSGRMRLHLGPIDHGCTLPSTAIYNRSGKPYILLVQGKTLQEMPVKIQVNDGVLARVAMIDRSQGRETYRELTGSEEIVTARQLEFRTGQTVSPQLSDW
ncbi:efflux RND transporter periplasmic adaptor subunit [Tuwongella immobilis]|uniref:CzcB-like barrel-sandwich hybrid domain-containing protein n=1 Tax=Tuwongella immobilis TaxID=692036 RepID=A0A6C2YSF2_9BACT|nr:efflux RND transporter periplasmic adaptor subunit [Tuwongella immobilis]VIP03802.1 RND family efflux transporter, MFP subunit OS=Singulisphaera acidiphila (strain ATCC BAA-1392 / DSM 18658 / VKM B-2454 / MOB10) GN=Sinac_0100 PE=4 SV=1: HlyD_2 [Tuwongella immobilis]VTS04971.1 RND family efflux transporter, MFP subunit OS=Singulisphaera acidiphila (strain ATCC BAA-1392 / DSM 18658 / VKM B-2454 / MOB10) GN=Sinac_0100 PE=4 SV=1: HlyD_2 [Tuwongella immobilis]